MPDVMIQIGDREFSVSCQEGEEHFLLSAAKMLNTEATALNAQVGRLPEGRMLLMSGLMLADKTAGMEEQVAAMETKVKALEAELANKVANKPAPERIEVPVIPDSVTDAMSNIAARAEALAAKVEESAASGA